MTDDDLAAFALIMFTLFLVLRNESARTRGTVKEAGGLTLHIPLGWLEVLRRDVVVRWAARVVVIAVAAALTLLVVGAGIAGWDYLT